MFLIVEMMDFIFNGMDYSNAKSDLRVNRPLILRDYEPMHCDTSLDTCSGKFKIRYLKMLLFVK